MYGHVRIPSRQDGEKLGFGEHTFVAVALHTRQAEVVRRVCATSTDRLGVLDLKTLDPLTIPFERRAGKAYLRAAIMAATVLPLIDAINVWGWPDRWTARAWFGLWEKRIQQRLHPPQGYRQVLERLLLLWSQARGDDHMVLVEHQVHVDIL